MHMDQHNVKYENILSPPSVSTQRILTVYSMQRSIITVVANTYTFSLTLSLPSITFHVSVVWSCPLVDSVPDVLCELASIKMRVHWIGWSIATTPLLRLSTRKHARETSRGVRLLTTVEIDQAACAGVSWIERDHQIAS